MSVVRLANFKWGAPDIGFIKMCESAAQNRKAVYMAGYRDADTFAAAFHNMDQMHARSCMCDPTKQTGDSESQRCICLSSMMC